jgi:hypothetical protein
MSQTGPDLAVEEGRVGRAEARPFEVGVRFALLPHKCCLLLPVGSRKGGPSLHVRRCDEVEVSGSAMAGEDAAK